LDAGIKIAGDIAVANTGNITERGAATVWSDRLVGVKALDLSRVLTGSWAARILDSQQANL